MRVSRFFFPTLREVPAEAEVISHQLMLRSGMIKKGAAGVFSYLPLGFRTIKKIEQIIREEMNQIGGQEILMPVLQPSELWKETGRWESMGQILMTLKDKNKRDFCLGPTHEEVITDIARIYLRSYRQLPIILYQIQTKFRDELRPRFGLLRAREFLMKDAYSFHQTKEDATRQYYVMHEAYHRVFSRCGLKFRAVEADTGDIGGSLSHEFHVLAKSGEDEILICDACGFSGNASYLRVKKDSECPKCKKDKMQSFRGIEVGHIFYLGKKYSESMKAFFLNEKGAQCHFEMGCYGIGISRTMAAAMEQNHDKNGIMWPISIAPFEVALVSLNMSEERVKSISQEIYDQFSQKKIEILWHDKEESAGVKFSDMDLIGIPIRITVGIKGLSQNRVDVIVRGRSREIQVPPSDVVSAVLKLRDELSK